MEEEGLFHYIKNLFKKKEKIGKDLDSERVLQVFENFSKFQLKDFLIPRHEIKAIDSSWNFEKIKKFVGSFPFRLYPVYLESFDNLKGYIKITDLVKGFSYQDFKWQNFIKPALFLPENISVFAGLKKLIEKGAEIAFLIDELSEITGMVLLRDIAIDLISRLFIERKKRIEEDKEITVPGDIKIKNLEDLLNVELPRGNYETLSGLIIEKLGRIPKTKEKIKIHPLEIEVLSSDEKKIHYLKIKKNSLFK